MFFGVSAFRITMSLAWHWLAERRGLLLFDTAAGMVTLTPTTMRRSTDNPKSTVLPGSRRNLCHCSSKEFSASLELVSELISIRNDTEKGLGG